VGLEAGAQVGHPLPACLAIVGGCLDLDELVGLERRIDLEDHGIREPLVADDDDRAQLVGLGAQFAAAGGGEWRGHGANIA
jgi:hypothetical protein